MVGPPPRYCIRVAVFFITAKAYGEVEINRLKLIIWFGLVTIHMVLMAHLLYGFDAKQLEQFRKTTKCQKCGLSNAKLANLDLSYADLSLANLSGADLSGATLYGANLTGALLVNANLSNTNLYEADLSKADVKAANFKGG